MNLPATLDANIVAIREVSQLIQEVTDPELLQEMRARVEAAKGWAKAHRKLKEVRLELLTVEVEILRRIVQLGEQEILSTRDRRAAEFFAALDESELKKYLAEHQSVTTAAGLFSTVERIQRLEEAAANRYHRGRAQAVNASPPDEDAEVDEARTERISVSAALAELVEKMDGSAGFSVSEMADQILSDVSSDRCEDESFRRGFEEVCREAVRRAPALRFGSTKLPRFLTARVATGKYMRVPIQAAKLWHLDDMCALRREQLAQDTAALERLDELRDQLWAIESATADVSIAGLVQQSMREAAKA